MAAPVHTNEGAAGTRAVARFMRVSAFKVRPVLDLVRGHDVETAREILALTERDAAHVVEKVLSSAVANALHNDEQIEEELYVSACFADEGPTLRRFRPRARGRATRIRKRTCHVTVIVSRYREEEIERRRQEDAGRTGSRAARRAAQQEAEARRAAERAAVAEEEEAPEATAEAEAAPEAEATGPEEAEAPEASEAPAPEEAEAPEVTEPAAEEAEPAAAETETSEESSAGDQPDDEKG
jgi:large subunit ribosomal protein L22